MRLLPILLVALLAFVASEPAFANFIPQVPLNVQLARADLVVVVRLGENTSCTIGARRLACSEILTDAVIKGSAAQPGVRRYLILSTDASEGSIEHIHIMGSALLFLENPHAETVIFSVLTEEFFLPVQANRSVVALYPSNVTEVQQAMCPLRHLDVPLKSAAEISPCWPNGNAVTLRH